MAWRYRWIWLATFAVCSVLVGVSKFDREVYPAVVFPSFGTPLPDGYVPPSSALSLEVLECGSTYPRPLSMAELFHRAPPSVHDRLAERLVDLPDDDVEWLLAETAEVVGEPVAQIAVVSLPGQPSEPDAVFEGRCP